MTFNEYQRLARRTQNENLNQEQREDHALHGMAAELGEIHSIYQKELQGHEFSTAHAMSQLRDMLCSLVELTDMMGLTLEQIAAHNVDKLRVRYSPRDSTLTEACTARTGTSE